MNGIIIINKEKDFTSRDVVNIVSKKFNTKKVGHTGTLDPLATGVLVVCINEGTKLVELLLSEEKEYIAKIIFGIETDTLDITGKILKEENVYISEKEIKKTLKDFPKIYNQEVPIYSAVKINGKKLYEYARENKKIELPKRKVEIKELSLIDIIYKNNKTIIKIKCKVSKGTYIRSLIRDIALKLNTIGVMEELTRTKNGDFKIEDAIKIEDLSSDKIIPLNDVLDKYKQVEIEDSLLKKIKNGSKIENIYNEDMIVFLKNNQVIALYKAEGEILKPYKMFLKNLND